MYLVETLAKKHRDQALSHGKIRIETINYYRKIEDQTRVDAEEGLGNVVWKGRELKAEDHNRIFTPFDKVELRKGWTIKNAGVPIHGAYPNFNLYTFCCSQVETVSQIASTSGGKASSKYFITDLPGFVRKLTAAIREIGEADIRKYEPIRYKEMIANLDVVDVNYQIRYSDSSKARIVTEENLIDFDPKKFISHDFFQKRTSFSFEREVRTCWVFIYKSVSGRLKPLQIPPPDVEFVDLELGLLPISENAIRNDFPIKTSPARPSDA